MRKQTWLHFLGQISHTDVEQFPGNINLGEKYNTISKTSCTFVLQKQKNIL
jgi:hypothetical protein